MISDYFRIVDFRLIDAEIIADKKVSYSEFSPDQGMLRGRLLFIDGSTLEFMEYLHRDQRLKYRFHLIDKIMPHITRTPPFPITSILPMIFWNPKRKEFWIYSGK